MNYQIVFHEVISKDYNKAYDWYEKKSPGLGEKFLEAVRNKINEISQHPEYYSEKSRKGYREVKVDIFPFVIVYKIYQRKKIIFVNSIHHQRKHPRRKYRK